MTGHLPRARARPDRTGSTGRTELSVNGRILLAVLVALALGTGAAPAVRAPDSANRTAPAGSSSPASIRAPEGDPPPAGIEGLTDAPAGPAAHHSKGAADRLEHLKALPYVGFDPDTNKSLRGVTHFDRDEASPGYNLYTDDMRKIYLADLSGKNVHRWLVPSPYVRCEWAELQENGDLLVVCVDHGLVRLDWKSHLIWGIDRKVHHDVAVKPDGTILTISHFKTSYEERSVWFDRLLTISPDGKVLKDWSSLDHLDELKKYIKPSYLDTPPSRSRKRERPPETGYDYFHTNTVEVLPKTPLGESDPRFREGNLLVSMRNASVIMVLDPDDFSVQWSWGPGELELQHMPTMLPNGHILLFDNGTYRGFSRVLEIEPPSGKIVWKYEGAPPKSFYSKWRGSVQRFDNGNTLICEAERGHAFEVTPEGKIVWEFWNPELSGRGERRRIYRMHRYPVPQIEKLLSGSSQESPKPGASSGHATGS